MKGFPGIFILVCLATTSGVLADVDSVKDEVPQLETCTEKCAQGLIKPCQRGCRFYDISTWGVLEDNTATNLDLCKKTCDQAYDFSESENEGCKNGCDMAEEEYKNTLSKDSYSALMDDFMMNAAFNMFAMMDSMMMSGSDGNLVVASDQVIQINDGQDHQGIIIVSVLEPQSNTPFALDKQVVLNTEDGGEKVKTTLLNDRVETNVQTNVNHVPTWDDSGFYRYPRAYLHSIKEMDAKKNYWDKFSGRVRNWWSCFTRKAGLPEIVLFLFWVSLMLLLIMSCCINFNWKKPKSGTEGGLAVISISSNKGDDNEKKCSKYFAASVAHDKLIDVDDDVPLLININ